MILLGWFIGVFIFWIIFLGLRLWCSYRMRININILTERIRSADQYEIAFLKGGTKLIVELAFYNLLRSGFLKRTEPATYSNSDHFQTIPNSDESLLNDLELELLHTFNQKRKFDLNLLKQMETVEKYRHRLSQSGYFCSLGSLIDNIWYVDKMFNVTAMVVYFLIGTPQSLMARFFIIICLMIFSYVVTWRFILGPNHYVDGNIITRNGRLYIGLFEKNYFALPDVTSDAVFQELFSVDACGG